MNVSYLGDEIIKTPVGNIRSLKFSPKVIVGRMFNHEDDLNIWISDDKNHILVKVEMKILVGSINAKLESVENIKFHLRRTSRTESSSKYSFFSKLFSKCLKDLNFKMY